MGNPNLPGSKRAVVLDAIDPVSTSTTVATAWIPMTNLARVVGIALVGALGTSATADAKIEQATDASGTNAKSIAGKSITQLTKTGSDDNKQALIEVTSDELDVNGGFTHVRFSITVGTAASLVAGLLLGFDARYDPLALQAASVDEVVL